MGHCNYGEQWLNPYPDGTESDKSLPPTYSQAILHIHGVTLVWLYYFDVLKIDNFLKWKVTRPFIRNMAG